MYDDNPFDHWIGADLNALAEYLGLNRDVVDDEEILNNAVLLVEALTRFVAFNDVSPVELIVNDPAFIYHDSIKEARYVSNNGLYMFSYN